MDEFNDIKFSWSLDRWETHLNILMIFLFLSFFHFVILIIGLLLYFYKLKYGEAEIFCIGLNRRTVQFWYGECDNKEVKKLPNIFFQGKVIEDHGKIYEIAYDDIKEVTLDISKTRLVFQLLDNRRIQIDIKGKGNEMSNETYELIRNKILQT